MVVLLCELDLPGVECADPRDLVVPGDQHAGQTASMVSGWASKRQGAEGSAGLGWAGLGWRVQVGGARNLLVDHSRGLPLGLGQDYVDEVLWGHGWYMVISGGGGWGGERLTVSS